MSKVIFISVLASLCAACATSFYNNKSVQTDAATIKHKASSEVRIVGINGQRVRAEEDSLRVSAGKHQFAVACMASGKTVERNVWANIKANESYQLAVEDGANCFTMIKQK